MALRIQMQPEEGTEETFLVEIQGTLEWASVLKRETNQPREQSVIGNFVVHPGAKTCEIKIGNHSLRGTVETLHWPALYVMYRTLWTHAPPDFPR